jgi:asparagine synthase (glutamine-hydrolysing)
MCGIAGIFGYGEAAPPVDGDELLRIREAMRMRGPDGAGTWLAADRRVGLAHRRLAIIDPGDGGAQPMASADGALHITFNGEIYNFRELKQSLVDRGHLFRSTSDTEVLLHLYAERGAGMVETLCGMYAFAIWDERRQELFLARDPFGIKPLYYADDGRTFRFASQVKALVRGGAVGTAPEPAGSTGFLLWGSVPDPFTLYREIHAVRAGTWMRVPRAGRSAATAFFDLSAELRAAEAAPAVEARSQSDQIRAAFDKSMGRHLVSDVPVGIFLSAGIDSSAIASAASALADPPLQGITLAFEEFRGTNVDEAPLAAMVASQFGLQHTVSRTTRDEFEAELPKLLDAMDQPSIDGVNTYLVSRAAARAGLKVALSGVGGDELFGGYPGFRQIPRAAAWLAVTRHLPLAGRISRRLLAPVLAAMGRPKHAGLFEYGGSYGGAYLLRRALFMPWELDAVLDPATVQAGLDTLRSVDRLEQMIAGLRRPRSRVFALEAGWYLRHQLLRDADWAGMAHSVEIRVPFVDVDLFRALAPLMASSRPPTKADMAGALTRPLPAHVVSRAKTGFSTPVADWIVASSASPRGSLRGWARQVLPPQPRLFRALVLATDPPGGIGGISKFNRDLVSALASMPQCADVVVVPRVAPVAGVDLPPRTRVLTRAASGKLAFVRTVLSTARGGHFDLVVAAHINLAGVSQLAARLTRGRSVLIIHGIDAWSPHRRWFARRALPAFSLIIGVSRHTLARFASWAGVDASRVRLLPNCVDLDAFRPGPKPADLAAHFGLTGRTVIMTLGRLACGEPGKGFDEVLETMPALTREVPELAYLICGDGPDRQRLEAKARQLGLADRVAFTGFVPEERKADYYRLADAFVLPSRGEGFGIVLLEALACGIPVLGSRIDAGREALQDGALGRLADPADRGELEAALLATVRSRRGAAPAGLEQYSYAAFEQRARRIVRELLTEASVEPSDARVPNTLSSGRV